MESEAQSVDDVWSMLRELTRLAFVYEAKAADNSLLDDEDLVKTMKDLRALMNSREDRQIKANGPLFAIFKVNQLIKIYDNFRKGNITEKAAKVEMWQTLTPPDDPDYFNEALAQGFHIPTDSEVAFMGGPKEAFIGIVADLNEISSRSIFNYQRDFKCGKLKPSLNIYFLPYEKRMEFVGTVFDRILNLKPRETKEISSILIEICEGNSNLKHTSVNFSSKL